MPRLKDLKDQQLYMLDREHVAGDLRSLFRSAIDVECSVTRFATRKRTLALIIARPKA